MENLLKKILFKKEAARAITIAYFVIGLYISYLFWYAIEYFQLLSHLDITIPLFSCLISLPFAIILIIYKVIGSMFYNKKINNILTMPIKSHDLFMVYLSEITLPSIKLETIFFITLSLNNKNYLSILKHYIISVILIYLISFIICSLLLLLIKFCPSTYIGYFFVFFQYGSFLLTIFILKDILLYLIFSQKTNIIILLNSSLESIYFLPLIVVGCFAAFRITYILFQHIFLQNIYKINAFQYLQLFSVRKDLFYIRYPYLFLETKRYLENKEIVFYSLLKSLVSTILIYNFIKSRYLIEKNLIDILLIFLFSVTNPFSIISYSSDSFCAKLARILPVDSYKMFHAKVLISFLLNEAIVFSYTLIHFFITPSKTTGLLLILYGILSNYLCSFVGVIFDYFMPKHTENKTELLHGNSNKLMLFIVIGIITFMEIYIINSSLGNKHLLKILILINIAILLLLTAYSKKLLEKQYD
uniref:hypothetical protein n=1 Tax=Agathobacter sp. TaxID=2021311 RepID=UPI004055D181